MADIVDVVGGCASLAALLEVSAYPKPGNIHRLRDFKKTKYEHFLASSVAISPWMGKLAKKSMEIKRSELELSEIEVGKTIFRATENMFRWQKGGNIHLGVILLLSPIAAASGIAFNLESIDLCKLRSSLNEVLRSTTSKDSTNIYKAINLAMRKENLGDSEAFDVTDPGSIKKILQNKMK